VVQVPDLQVVFAALQAADPDVMERDELAVLTAQIAQHKAWCEALQVRVTRRQRQLAEQGRAEAPRDLLAREGRQSGRDARTADDRERVCSVMPGFEDALAGGTVSAGHVDAIAGAIRNLDEPTQAEFVALGAELLKDAETVGVDAFERSCRDLARHLAAVHAGGSDADELDKQRRMSKVKRWTDRESGMRHTLISLDPVRDAKLWAGIDRARRRLRRRTGNGEMNWDQLQVEAVIDAVSGAEPGECVVELVVLVDEQTLRDGLHAHSVCELADGQALPVSTVRQLACGAEIIPVVLDGTGRALDVGRAARLATPAQRQALRAMHRTCMFPTCSVPFDDCRIHHIVPWEQGGATDLANLGPMCESGKHHHLVHEGGWVLTMTPDRIATWTRPDGTVFHTGTTIDRAPDGIVA
jgi:hypothetical protein